ncbi:TonB-dependent receptor [Pedobacter cryoconitis]|uniref:Iron complex outermembrane receptor protein n=1 Tax=Pedobacter cryoconitis TaxID=188932 RepID=A0A7X0J044_9SPHI|nr:TonB-dependent receptor [Pedobacter cryoconitis]MBB6498465.1 iron complex outermembrane receptor protein [Pedobacter cryoconitis]
MTFSTPRVYLTAIFILLLHSFTFAQTRTGTITGTITTSDGVPAELVTVAIKGIISTTTDKNGSYTLKKIPAGKHIVIARLVGVHPISKEITLAAGQAYTYDITLSTSNEQLKEVVVSGGKTNKFAVKESALVSKMPLKNLENPQVYAVVSKELMTEQVITNYDDALKNVPGIDKLWSSTGRGGDGAGYFSLRGFAVQPTLVNGLPGLTNGSLDVSNVERIEVLKGPSGTLFGSSLISYGGLINTVTKQPHDGTATEVTYTAGSYGLNRVTADINTPLDKDHKVLFRMNAAYQDENSFQDAGFKKTRFVAPSLSYQVNDRLSFLLNTQFLSAEGTNPTMLFLDRGTALKVNTIAGLNYDPKKSYTSNNLSIKTPVASMQAQMNYKLSDQWNSQTLISRGSAKSDGYYSYLYEMSSTVPGYPNVPSTFRRSVSDQNTTTETTDIQQNFNGDFQIAGLRSRIVAGLDYFNRTYINNSSNYVTAGIVSLGGTDTGVLTKESVDALIAASKTYTNTISTQQVYSAYASDILNFTPQLSGMFSLRVDHFVNGGQGVADADKYGQTFLSPKFGLVYQILKDRLSVFGNFMNGFTNVAPISVSVNGVSTTRVFKPEQANQWETGVKTDLFDGKLTASLSYYDIKVSNTVLSVGENDYTQGGKNYSKGFEAEIQANPFPGFNIIAGYSKNKSKLTSGPADYEGRRPESAGPEDLINAWISYKLMNGSAKGLGFGFGGNYAGKNSILNRATTGVFTLPSYTVLNAAVNYQTGHFNFALKMDNLTNKIYYKGWSTIEPMRPRTVAGSIGYRF